MLEYLLEYLRYLTYYLIFCMIYDVPYVWLYHMGSNRLILMWEIWRVNDIDWMVKGQPYITIIRFDWCIIY